MELTAKKQSLLRNLSQTKTIRFPFVLDRIKITFLLQNIGNLTAFRELKDTRENNLSLPLTKFKH